LTVYIQGAACPKREGIVYALKENTKAYKLKIHPVFYYFFNLMSLYQEQGMVSLMSVIKIRRKIYLF